MGVMEGLAVVWGGRLLKLLAHGVLVVLCPGAFGPIRVLHRGFHPQGLRKRL
jgi:hypothetical protein